jgi:hypothetical protein
MAGKDAAEKMISQHLNQVRAHLAHLPADEVEDIIDNVRSHIDSEIRKFTLRTPPQALVEKVLSEMDAPEAYAESASLMRDDEELKPRVPRFLIIATILLPFGVVAMWMFFTIASVSSSTASTTPTEPTTWQWIARFTILPLGILAPFVCTGFGLLGVSKIHSSRGRFLGIPLALFVGLFYPILLLDFALFIALQGVFGNILGLELNAGLVLLVLLAVNGLVYWLAWRWASRPTGIA